MTSRLGQIVSAGIALLEWYALGLQCYLNRADAFVGGAIDRSAMPAEPMAKLETGEHPRKSARHVARLDREAVMTVRPTLPPNRRSDGRRNYRGRTDETRSRSPIRAKSRTFEVTVTQRPP
jgi:hypothetical protein